MAVVFKNNAKTTLASGVNSSATSITVSDGSVFPSLTGSDIFFATLDDGTNNEIVKVTAISSNTLTVVRAQESTTARSFSTGDEAQLRLTAGILGLFSQTGVAITDEIEAYLDANGLTFPDDVKAQFGASNDLQIYHDGTTNNSVIKEIGTGNLELWGNNVKIMNVAGTETQLDANPNGAVTLYYDNSPKLATTTEGIDVTGLVTIDTSPGSTYGVSEALRIDDTGGINDRALQIFELLHSGARSHRLTFNTNITTDGSAYTYTQGNYGGSSQIEFGTNGPIVFYTDDQNTAGSTTAITPTERLRIKETGEVEVQGELIANGNIRLTNNSNYVATRQILARDTNGLSFKTSGGGTTMFYTNAGDVTVSNNLTVSGNVVVSGTVDGRDIATDGTKLDGIEASATADQTNAEIRAAVEAASDSNVFTDADHTKLNAIEASATADQTQSEINALGITAIGLSGSPNITVGTINSGNITSTGTGNFGGKVTISDSGFNNHLRIERSGQGDLYLTPSGNQLMLGGGGFSPGNTNSVDLGRSDKYWRTLLLGTSLQMGGTTVIDASRNLTNIAQLSSTGSHLVAITSGVGVGGTPADANSAELGAGFLNLARDDTADAKQILFGKNGAEHSFIKTTSTSMILGSGVNTNALIIGLDGDVGVGTTSPPSGGLEISKASPVLRIRENDQTNHFSDIRFNSSMLRLRSRANTSNGGIRFEGFDGSTITTYGMFTNAGNFQIGSTTVIDSSRNLTNIGTISSGVITSSGLTFSNGGDRSLTGPLNEDLIINARPNDTSEGLHLQINGTDKLFIKQDGSATFAGTISGTLASTVTATTQAASDNSTKVSTTAYVTTAIANLVDGAPSTLNTLNEIAAALNDDAALNTTLTNSIAGKLSLTGGTLSGNLAFSDDGEGISFYGGEAIKKTSGTGIVVTALSTRSLDTLLQIDRGSGGTRYSVYHEGYHPEADTLTTPRTIGGVSFDGSANINLPGVNTSGNQNTSGTAAGLSGTPNITVGTISSGAITTSSNLNISGDIFGTSNFDIRSTGNIFNTFGNSNKTFFRTQDGTVRFVIDSTGKIGAGGNIDETPDANLHIRTSDLGGTSGDQQEIARFQTNVSNGSALRVYTERHSTGTSWTSAQTKIQQRIDATDMGYILFNGSGNTYGIEIGTHDTAGQINLRHKGTVRLNTVNAGVNVTGALQVGSTTVIDSSKNLSNIGTITASGDITTADRIISKESSGGFYKLHTDGTFRAAFHDNNDVTSIYADGDGSNPFITFNGGATHTTDIDGILNLSNTNASLRIGGTEVISTGRNLSNIGTISSGDITISDSATPSLILNDTGNAGAGGASANIKFNNTAGTAMAIGYTANSTADSDMIISTNAGGTYGGYLNLAANGITDAKADIVLEPKTNVFVATGDVGVGQQLPRTNINSGSFFKPDSNGKFVTINGGANGGFIMLESTTTTDSDQIGGLFWTRTAGQGDAHKQVAGIDAIQAVYSGGSNLDGARLRFYTKPGGSGTNTPRMQIDQNGNIFVGSTAIIDQSRNLTNIGTISSGTINAGNVELTSSGSIEIIRNGDAFIDFKSSSSEDFDCRIQQISDGIQFITGGNGATATALTLNSSQNATFAGTINSGAITSTGNLSLTTTGSEIMLDAYSTSQEGGGIFFREGFQSSNKYNLSIIARSRSNDGSADGLSINGYEGIFFSTGSNSYQERFGIDISGNISVGGTTIINQSRNLTNIGTISSGAITSSGLLTVSSSNDAFPTIAPATKAIFATDNTGGFEVGITLLGNASSIINFGDYADEDIGQINYSHSSNSLVFKTNATTALTLNSSQNATFAGTISSGAITSSGVIKATQYEPYSSTSAISYKGYASRDLITAVDGAAYYYGSDGAAYGIVIQGGHPICKSVKIGSVNAGTTVIDASRNLTNIGTYSGTGNMTIAKSTTPIVVFETSATAGQDATLKIRGARTSSNTSDIATIFFDNKTSSPYTLAKIIARDPSANHGLGNGQLRLQTSSGGTLSDNIVCIQSNIKFATGGQNRAEITSAGVFNCANDVVAFGTLSDIRLKENIKVIENPLDKVKQIRGVNFSYKKDGRKSTGLIAQELEKVLPNAIFTTHEIGDDEEIKAIRYGNVVGLLVEAIKEQQDQIEYMKSEIKTLKEANNGNK